MGACASSSARSKKSSQPSLKQLASETHFSLDEVYALQELFETVSNSLVADGLIHKHEWAAALLGPSAAAAVAAKAQAKKEREEGGEGEGDEEEEQRRKQRASSSAEATTTTTATTTTSPSSPSSPGLSASSSSLFVDRVFAAFDAAENSVLDFPEFVRGLSVFHPRAPAREKADFAFRLYDLGKTGAIERRELRELLRAALSDNPGLRLSDADVDAVVDETFDEADTARDGVIHPREWLAMAEAHPEALRFMTLPGLAAVTQRYPSYVFKKN